MAKWSLSLDLPALLISGSCVTSHSAASVLTLRHDLVSFGSLKVQCSVSQMRSVNPGSLLVTHLRGFTVHRPGVEAS